MVKICNSGQLRFPGLTFTYLIVLQPGTVSSNTLLYTGTGIPFPHHFIYCTSLHPRVKGLDVIYGRKQRPDLGPKCLKTFR